MILVGTLWESSQHSPTFQEFKVSVDKISELSISQSWARLYLNHITDLLVTWYHLSCFRLIGVWRVFVKGFPPWNSWNPWLEVGNSPRKEDLHGLSINCHFTPQTWMRCCFSLHSAASGFLKRHLIVYKVSIWGSPAAELCHRWMMVMRRSWSWENLSKRMWALDDFVRFFIFRPSQQTSVSDSDKTEPTRDFR